jgi:hypothetical protein
MPGDSDTSGRWIAYSQSLPDHRAQNQCVGDGTSLHFLIALSSHSNRATICGNLKNVASCEAVPLVL